MIVPEGKKVVYLLGAGASFNALPVVDELPSALRKQPFWILHECPEVQNLSHFNDYRIELGSLASAAEKYGTIDTYARSLYLLKKGYELARLKLHLAMYFLLEQAVERKTYSNPPPVTQSYLKSDQIDKRYMTWLAQLLDNDGVLSKRVRVLSWNYDLQLEHAIGLYRGLNDLSEVHSAKNFWVYPDPSRLGVEDLWDPSLIHLNGIAGQALFRGHANTLYRTLSAGNPKQYILKLFQQYGAKEGSDLMLLQSMNSTFHFAWEDQSVAQQGIALANACLRKADVLVVIGYSFPPFNRSIDIELMKSFVPNGRDNTDRRIYIQSPDMTAETFGHLFSLNDRIVGLRADNSVNQFYLPPELFN